MDTFLFVLTALVQLALGFLLSWQFHTDWEAEFFSQGKHFLCLDSY